MTIITFYDQVERFAYIVKDCYSIELQRQLNHVSAALFSFVIAQLECKKQQLCIPEPAIRSIRLKNIYILRSRLARNYASYFTTKA